MERCKAGKDKVREEVAVVHTTYFHFSEVIPES